MYATWVSFLPRRLPATQFTGARAHLFLTLPVNEEAVLVDFEHALRLVVEGIFFLDKNSFVK